MRCCECQAWEMRADNRDFGYCKRKAPQPTVVEVVEDTEYQIVWPSTGKDDWCMELKEIGSD